MCVCVCVCECVCICEYMCADLNKCIFTHSYIYVHI